MGSHSKKRTGKEKTSKKKSLKNTALEHEMKPCTVQVYKMSLEDIAPHLKRPVRSLVPVSSSKIQKSKKATISKPKKLKEKKVAEKVVISLSKMCILNPEIPRTRKSSRLQKTSRGEDEKKRAFLASLGLVDHETAKARITELNCPQMQASRWAAIRALQPLIFKKNQALAKKLLRIRKTKMTKSMKATATSQKRGRPAKKNKEKKKKNNNKEFSSSIVTTMVSSQNLNPEIVHHQVAGNGQMNPICRNKENSVVPALPTSSYQEVSLGRSRRNTTKNFPQTSSLSPFDSSRGNTELSLIQPWVTGGEVSKALPMTSFEKLEILQVFLADIIDHSPPPGIECITID